MKHKSDIWESMLIVAIVIVAGLCAQSEQVVHAQDADLDGPIIQIGPDTDGQGLADPADHPKTRIVEEPVYWIGIRGRSVESEVLRTHLQLAEDMGVVVEGILPESPAAKAGLRKHDIILRAAGDAVDNMSVLQNQVRAGGEKLIELKIIRYGKPEKLVIVPELRPQEFDELTAGLDANLWGNPQELLEQMLRGDGRLGAHRLFGPGIIINGQRQGIGAMPNGVSISVQRQNDGPAQITVKKGGQTWNIVGNDEESLQQLPDDVRPFVEQMLRGQGNNLGGASPLDLNAELQRIMPRGFGDFGGAAAGDPIADRIEQLERKLQDLQKRLEEEPDVQ